MKVAWLCRNGEPPVFIVRIHYAGRMLSEAISKFLAFKFKKLYSDINDMEFKVIVKILCVNNLKTMTVIQ